MFLRAVFVVFGACIVWSIYGKSINSVKEARANVDGQDYFTREERRAKQCTYMGQRYPQGATIDKPVKPDYARCDRCTCIGRKFRNCTKIFDCELGFLPCGKKDYEFPEGDCCPVCKRKDCSEDREVNEKWWSVKEVTGENPLRGVCSRCECKADRKEYCEDHLFTCHPIPGCIEYEEQKDQCCPKCVKWLNEKTTTAEWFTIPVTTEAPTPPHPPFPFFSRNTNED